MDKKQSLLIDTEPETSMELDGEENLHTKVKSCASTHNANKTLFNITLENTSGQIRKSMEFKKYETRFHQEMKDWKSVLCNAYKDLKQSKQKHPIVDKSILPAEKREYLEKAPCLQNFIRESIDFRQQAVLFIEYDYAEIMDMIESLENMCEHRISLIKAIKIAENLANAP